jgi:signal transduction histidine kinase
MSQNILIVEDERIVAMEIEEQVRSLGYNVIGPAASAVAALRLCETAEPDLALMDIRIEGDRDGIECVESLRRRFDVPVIYLTALADSIIMGRAKLTTPAAYLTKPIRDDELKAAIEITLYRREMERALDRQRAEFATMLNHDIQTPLNVVSGCAELLAEKLQKAGLAPAEELLRCMRSSLADTVKLIADYLSLLTLDPQRNSIANAHLAVNEALQQIKTRFESEASRRGVRLEVDLADDLPAVETDRLTLERIIGNLVFNALKFTLTGGLVTLSSKARGHEVALAVTDTGCGIPVGELPRIFDKGWRGADSAAVQGSGIGLFVVKTLTESLGGRVEVDSAVGRGTSFTLFLPIAPASVVPTGGGPGAVQVH